MLSSVLFFFFLCLDELYNFSNKGTMWHLITPDQDSLQGHQGGFTCVKTPKECDDISLPRPSRNFIHKLDEL